MSAADHPLAATTAVSEAAVAVPPTAALATEMMSTVSHPSATTAAAPAVTAASASVTAADLPLLSWFSFIPESALPFQTEATVSKALTALESVIGHSLTTAAFAERVDTLDPLACFREEFHIPKANTLARAIRDVHTSGAAADADSDATASSSDSSAAAEDMDGVYLCGNSLGLLPRKAHAYVESEMRKWATIGVEGHFLGARPWARIDEEPTALSVSIVGAKDEAEVAVMNSLSVNLHLLLTSFYRPSASRFKILMEHDAFCSDHHIVHSQVQLHGRRVEDALVVLKQREGESTLRTEDIVAAINATGDELALVLLPGVQFYTGQLFDMAAITAAAHAVGAYAGFDLAHAVGNVPLRLHEWQVDFAAWCSYKYLNSGPGATAGIFVHESHHSAAAGSSSVLPKLRGWWGQHPSQRFKMSSVHVEKPGAQSWMLSNPAVLPTVCLQASLELHSLAQPNRLRAKSIMLTAYLERLLIEQLNVTHYTQSATTATSVASASSTADATSTGGVTIRILTPSSPSARGCQLSLLFSTAVRPIHRALSDRGVVTDVREPNVIRVSPTPLYNKFSDVHRFVQLLAEVLREFKQ